MKVKIENNRKQNERDVNEENELCGLWINGKGAV